MKRWVSAVTGLLLAASGPSAVAKDLPTIDAALGNPADQKARSRPLPQSKLKEVGKSSRSTPAFRWADRSKVDERVKSALQRMSAEQAARVHLEQLYTQYNLSAQVASTLEAVTKDSGKGPIVVTFKQKLGGVEVFRQQLTMLMNARHELISVSGAISSHANPGTQSSKLAFTMDAPTAIARAFEDLNGERLDASSLQPSAQKKGAYTSYTLAPSASSGLSVSILTPPRAKRVFFPLQDRLVPAYYLELHTGAQNSPEADYYAYVISAQTGQVLFRNNLTVSDSFSYRVWAEGPPEYIPQDGPQGLAGTPHPTGAPSGYQAPFIPPSLITLQNAPYSQNDPWLPSGATQTVGNNIDAYADISGADGLDAQDFRATATAPGVFDRVYDVTQEPDVSVDQAMAAVTNLFYVTNFLHDWYYDFGFDEASGNAQADNYGRGGLAGDSLKAEAQDISGLNNANMLTPADGERPRMQMYLFTPNAELLLEVLAPPAIAGQYPTNTASFGPLSFDVTGDLVLVQDAGGASPTDGCEAPFANAAELPGKIAIMDRGSCNFTLKAKNAQDAGAVAVIIANNTTGGPPGLGGSDPTVTVPTLSMSQEDGNTVKAALAGGPVTLRMLAGVGGAYRDGSLDNGIIAHEWGHYISNRLIADSSGLGNNQGRSMGEGWGDFTALMMFVRAEDQAAPGNDMWQGAYGLSGYTSSGGNNDGYLFGLRRYPYSTDFDKNPLTFKHIEDGVALPTNAPISPDSGGPNSEVHNSGEVWANMLWECYAALLRDSQRLPFELAQTRMKLYVTLGYTITPPSPTFTEARDAVLAVAYAVDPVDYQLCHAAFARRGAGLRAQSPSAGSVTHAGVVESFATGKDVALTGVGLVEDTGSCDDDGVLDNGETGVVLVRLQNTGTGTLTQTTAQVSAAAGSGMTFANGGVVQFPAMEPFQSFIAEIPVSLNGPAGVQLPTLSVTYGDPEQAIPGNRTVSFAVRVNSDDVAAVSASDDVESNIEAWTYDFDPNLDLYYPWFRYEEGADYHYFYGPNPTVTSDIYLISPVLQVASTGSFGFTFIHRYDFEATYDGGVIELSNDGGQTWTDIGASIGAGQGYTDTLVAGGTNPINGRDAYSGTSTGYPDWLPVTVNLGTAYAGQMVQLRFRIGADVNTAGIGWDIDNVSFTGITNTPFPALLGEQDACEGNLPPVANAGADQTVDERTTVTLNGSGSSDPDGDALTYAWTQTAGPAVTLSGANTANPTFMAPEVTAATVLTFSLTVSDTFQSSTDTVNITVNNVNRAPVANAGPDQTANERSTVTLEGSGTDPDGDTLTYAWTQTAGPSVTLSGANTANPTFMAPEVTAATVLTFSLTVSDGTLTSTDTVDVTVNNVNRAPVANAGADQTVDERTSVTLDGSGSTDPDSGTTLTYAWTQTAGPSVTLTGATTANPTFTAPSVAGTTTLTFSLTVSDGTATSTDTVNVTVNNVDPQNRVPTANAGEDQTVDERTAVTLDGSGSSDPDNDALTYAWVQTAGPSVTLTGANTASPSFTAPSVPADTVLTFELTVSDGSATNKDTVSITVRNVDQGENRAPVANAGPDQTVDEGASVTLEGSGSDPDNDTLSYAWTQTGGSPTVTLTGANTANPTFFAPSVSAETVLTFTLTVSDGSLTHTDTVSITVRDVGQGGNQGPTADAGADQTVDEGAAATLSGSGTDPDGDTLTYTWVQTAGPTVTLTGADTASATFTAPSVDADTVLTFELTVSDGRVSAKDSVNITVRNETAQNGAPTANAGEDQTVTEGGPVTLSGSGTDPDGDTLTYEWTQTAGPNVTLSGADTATATFTAPDVNTNTVLRFSLKVTDSNGASAEDSVSITVKPEGNGGGEDEGGCACSSDSSAAGSLMPLLMIGMALLSRRRKWLR